MVRARWLHQTARDVSKAGVSLAAYCASVFMLSGLHKICLHWLEGLTCKIQDDIDCCLRNLRKAADYRRKCYNVYPCAEYALYYP